MAPSRASDSAKAAIGVTPLSPHVQDPALQPFLDSNFDHVDHLNAIIPALSIGGSSPSSTSRGGSSLAELVTHTQSQLSQLSASTTRLSDTLTSLTDDIIRTGSRLAYEVEVLRGDAVGLSETLHETLIEDVKRLMPGGLDGNDVAGGAQKNDTSWAKTDTTSIALDTDARTQDPDEQDVSSCLDRLRMLATVKERLESVVQVFGQAMEWTLPPSELVASSFISVSAPDEGREGQDREAKGQAMAKKLRDEVTALVKTEGNGVDAAHQRVEQLRELVKVWKGTAEEKARLKFVDNLAKVVEDQQKALRSRR
ncbi:MAG: hypothetical protein M1823_003140 [Watsoniomyces obsoletus]|nr:MAG: hypothetical protein M1823_003140 [Watsoniomyces obsoletus]